MRSIIALLFLTTPAFALNEPVIWRDPDTSCAYWLTPQGGIAPRYRRDGARTVLGRMRRRETPRHRAVRIKARLNWAVVMMHSSARSSG